MLAVIRVNNLCNLFMIVMLSTISVARVHAAPATADSKIETPKKTILTVPTIKTIAPTTIKPALNIKTLPRQKLTPAKLPPAPKPLPAPREPDSTAPTAPDTVDEELDYVEPGYDDSNYYYQDYEPDYGGGGGGYDSPGGYYPDQGDDYYQEPEYEAPAQQPFRGIEGSLLDQQQFEFQPLEELSPSSSQAEDEGQPAHEPGQVLVATTSMDDARQLQQAVASAGYRPKSRTNLDQLGFVMTIFRLPADVSVMDAVAQLKEAFPGFLVSANTRYIPLSIGGNKKNYARPLINWDVSSSKCANKIKIGLLDTEVDTGHRQFTTSNVKNSSVLPAGISNKKSDHGTAIASLLVGSEQGLLPDAELFAVNIFRNANGKLDTTTSWVIKAINDLLEKKVSVINLSLGGDRDELLEYVSKTVFEKQVLMVAAAGNSGPKGKPVYPAAYPDVVAVTAVDARRKIYSKASRGDYIDLAAPGVDIWSASSGNGRYYTGTSFAVPFVTAALAVLRASKPTATVTQIKSHLLGMLKDMGKPGKDAVYGKGLLNARDLCP